MNNEALNERLAEMLAEHEWTRKSRCTCHWTPRACMFPEPYVNGADQYRAHVAAALVPVVRAMQAEAWGEGGAHVDSRGVYDPDDNPYRSDESEGGR
ncbi:hypothetical protein [Nocardioides soli]|uniref:Uncharacterized protein n=1 Tax=Nocardioides soli TaxID=1036020 RepID=A0A7W4VSJ7_9ACTN|nr:hypothetical protein [Nocardioides soli]MBB3041005.1 hypothetical protein [Nocardioides soli]